MELPGGKKAAGQVKETPKAPPSASAAPAKGSAGAKKTPVASAAKVTREIILFCYESK